MTKWTSILTLVTMTLLSCCKSQPAGFWTDFDRETQTDHINDQGPWGGHRTLHWKSDKQGAFDTKRVIDFAITNGWTLVDSSDHTSDHMDNWTYFSETIFPLAHTGFDPKVTSLVSTYEKFPRWTTSDVIVLHFQTGWISIEPGTDDSYETNGFVMINKDKSEMTVYHLWGE